MTVSPLTLSNDVTLLRTIEVNKLIQDWQDFFNIDITDELHSEKEIHLYQCNQTKLKFFLPFNVAGSENIYQKLENIDWYYMPRKWEHDVAIEDLDGCRNILEVGCGRGAFIERISKETKLKAQGIELNPSAVQYAKTQGISVEKLDLHELANEKEGAFDAVCAFQVLEHVVNPREFLTSLIKLVAPNGKLIISVPNSDSFMKNLDKKLLDQPPHHMTQWCMETFNSLTSIFPLEVNKFRIEPLAEYHIDWYLSTIASRFPKIKPLQSLGFRITYSTLKPLLKASPRIRNLIVGHTLYVCFNKTNREGLNQIL